MRHTGSFARTGDGLLIAAFAVLIPKVPRQSFRFSSFTSLFPWSVMTALGENSEWDGVTRAENVRRWFSGIQVGAENRLGTGADCDSTSHSKVCGLVDRWNVDPNILAGIDIPGTYVADVLGSHARQELDLDHGGHNRVDVIDHRHDVLVGNGPNGDCFLGFGASFFEAVHRLKSLVYGDGKQLFGH